MPHILVEAPRRKNRAEELEAADVHASKRPVALRRHQPDPKAGRGAGDAQVPKNNGVGAPAIIPARPSTRHRLDATQVFNGADSIFRGILVPVFGLKAQLLRRDARVLAEETTKGLTAEQKAAVVASFNEGVSKKTN